MGVDNVCNVSAGRTATAFVTAPAVEPQVIYRRHRCDRGSVMQDGAEQADWIRQILSPRRSLVVRGRGSTG